ncbi:MAG: hypothetical protein U9Q77_08960 [Candidatus Marinimicrobia bacterium]|nr:hypothetical protein [Candidatus Neomarinimicrobiota bacterium]
MLANQNMTPDSQPNPYLVQKIMTASPEELISYIFEAAIKACAQEDHRRALEAVQELINSLNFEAGDISSTFYKVYSEIADHIHKREFDTALTNLMDLRKTWSQAMNIR